MSGKAFLQGEKNPDGIDVNWILSVASDQELEDNHQWVQWAFPLPEPRTQQVQPRSSADDR